MSNATYPRLDGIPDFNALHSGKHNNKTRFCAFDVLAIDGDHSAACRYFCERPIWNIDCEVDRVASSSTH
jgi:hypothetical protein